MSYPYARTKVGVVGASAVSVDLSGRGKELLLSSTTDCWVSFTGPAVANQSFFLPTDTPTKFNILYAPSLSVIQDSAGGFLSTLEFGDVSLIQTIHRYFSGDASLLKVGTAATFDGDSSLLTVIAATFSGDATIDTAHTGTYTGDATFGVEHRATATGDSNLLTTVTGLFDGSAVLVTP